MSSQQKENQVTQDDRYSNQAPLSSPPHKKGPEKSISDPAKIPSQVPDTHPNSTPKNPSIDPDGSPVHEPLPKAPEVPEHDPDNAPLPQKV